jgi:chemotaxis protein CheC
MHITAEQLDALQELLNIGVGKAAGALNQMIGKPIRLQIPYVRVGKISDLINESSHSEQGALAAVRLPFTGSFSGSAFMLFPTESAEQLVAHLTGEANDSETINVMKEATLTEIGNILINGVMGSITNVLDQQLFYTVPTYLETTLGRLLDMDGGDSTEYMLWAQTKCTIEDFNTGGEVLLMFGVRDLYLLQSALEALTSSATAGATSHG